MPIIIIIIIIIIIMATGTISKSSREYLNNIPEEHEKRNYSKHAHRELHNMLWKVRVLIYKNKTYNMGSSITCAMNCNEIIAAILYILEIWFVSGI